MPLEPSPLTIQPAAVLFGYPVHATNRAHALALVTEALHRGQRCHVVTLNPEMLMQGDANPPLGAVLRSANVVIPDGAGVVWALKQRLNIMVSRTPGIEVSEALIGYAAQQGFRVGLLGASPDVMSALLDFLTLKYPALQVCFAHHGYFDSPEHEDLVTQQCLATQPQLLLVALGVPKQELWIAENLPKLRGAVAVGVGGSFDVWSGQKKRAPWAFRALHLEWLYRISSEPWRIQRILGTLPAFVWRVITSPTPTEGLQESDPSKEAPASLKENNAEDVAQTLSHP
ncbi:MAG: WecB/TagA/CpsF family glycosyltransferase [Vampirovibrionales bacterium]|nr:WecB/TagA/CpsF family glycosyltransferase [Vampirovibrionales bacterium]